jgi:hypothetical protein
MRYEAFQYLYPPRPEKAVAGSLLGMYEQRGWVAQHKMDGTCNVLAVSPDRKIVAMNRHKENHKAWAPTPASTAPFRNLPGNGWYVFVAELMHSKVSGIRDINYVNDILVADGSYLVGETFANRARLVRDLFPGGDDRGSHYEVHPNLWVAKVHTHGFRRIFEGLERPEHEGIVVKNPKAVLEFCGKANSNVHWSAKSRRPTKLRGF